MGHIRLVVLAAALALMAALVLGAVAFAVPALAAEPPTWYSTDRLVGSAPLADVDPSVSGNNVAWVVQNADGTWTLRRRSLASGTVSDVATSAARWMLPDVDAGGIAFNHSEAGGSLYDCVKLFDLGTGSSAVVGTFDGPAEYPGAVALAGDKIAWADRSFVPELGHDTYHVDVKDLASGAVQTAQLGEMPVSSISLDGDRLAYDAVGRYRLWYDVGIWSWTAGAFESPISGDVGQWAWSPSLSRDRVAYVTDHGMEPPAEDLSDQDIAVMDLATRTVRRLTRSGVQTQPKLSGDFVVFRDGPDGGAGDVLVWHLPSGGVYRVGSDWASYELDALDATRGRIAHTVGAGVVDGVASTDVVVTDFGLRRKPRPTTPGRPPVR